MGASENRRLFTAVSKGDTQGVHEALSEGAEINAMARGTGRTPLIEAVIAGHPAVVQALIDAGADLEARCSAMGLTALAWSAGRQGGSDSAAALLRAGAQVDARQAKVGATPLMLAAGLGDTPVLRSLMEAGADVNAVDAFGRNALTRAANPEVVADLIGGGATPPTPAQEPAVLPWPAIDPERPDHDDPVRLVRGFMLAMEKWESAAAARLKDPDFNQAHIDDVFASSASVADPYLALKHRPFRAGSIGTPRKFKASDVLTEVRRLTRSRVELVVLQPIDQPVRAEMIFVVVRSGGQWLIDAVKVRALVVGDRYRNALGPARS